MASPQLHDNATVAETRQPAIEVDDNDDTNSPYGEEDMASFTQSMTSSVIAWEYNNGRRYHAYKAGSYMFPNDEQENDRLDLQHQMLNVATDNKLYYAPIGDDPKRILDIGTGTGLWAIEMGDKFPSARVIGCDLSPIQPNLTPPNVEFEVDDVEMDWTYSTPFDYIHCRYMVGSISDWPALTKKVFRYTKPGGWAEFQDFDVRFYSQDGSADGSAICKFTDLATEAGEKLGRTVVPAVGMVDRVRDAGFVDIHHIVLKIPLGRWPKDKKMKIIGSWNVLNILEGLEGFCNILFGRGLGWSTDEIRVLIEKCQDDIKNPNIHAQHDYHIVYGRKPTDTTT